MEQPVAFTHAVVGTYSFAEDISIALFTNESDAIKYLRETYAGETANDKDMGNNNAGDICEDGTYAKIVNFPRCGGKEEISEWRVTSNISVYASSAPEPPTTLRYLSAGGIEGRCDVMRKGNVVVAKERDDNPGMSITNAIEAIALAVCVKYDIKPEDLEIYELYVHPTANNASNISLKYVTFADDALSGPRWAGVLRDGFELAHFSLAPLCKTSSFHK